VVKVRLSGEQHDIGALIGLLAGVKGNAAGGSIAVATPGGDVAQFPAVELLDRSWPSANRYDRGQRVYLTVRVTTRDDR
jgi:hypothetical protein